MSTQTDTIREALMEGSHVARIQALAALSELETQPKEGLSENTLKDLTDFWKSAWDEDGTREKIINELWDYTVFMENTAKVYDHLTRGNISKVNTLPQAVIDEVERIHQEEIDEAVEEAAPSVDVRGLTADNERLRAAGNEMCMLLCLFYKEAAVTMPETARKDLLAKINAWDAAAKEQGFTPTNTEDK